MTVQRSECVIEGEARPGQGWLPAGVVAVVGLLLAAIIGMTSDASPWLPGDGNRAPQDAIVGQVLAIAIAGGLCILLALVWIQAPGRSRAKRKRTDLAIDTDEVGSSLRAGSVILIGGILVVVALVVVFSLLFERADILQPPVTSGMTVGDPGVAAPAESAPSASPVFGWFLFGLAASTAVLLPCAVVVRRRLRLADAEPEPAHVALSDVLALGDTIDQIERDPDARRAIIRAYAQMEHAFDAAGIPRLPYEAPFEYLGRALRSLRVSPPAAGRLAGLFERARFSQHVVGADTKDDAIQALREIEQQMQALSR